MATGVLHNMVGLIALLAISHTDAIRVYWNTNTGPIVPPTSTPAPVPQPPFRDPAPVWEDHSDDVPNPNPYVYILPPPSRPKYNDITAQRKQNQQEATTAGHSTILTTLAPTKPTTPTPTTQQVPTGRIIETPAQNSVVPVQNQNQIQSQQQPQQQQHSVPSLSVRYVPNQGLKYYAVVPVTSGKSAYLKSNDALLDKQQQQQADKLNGRYNAKLKKYKAYEKVKYVPYYMYFDGSTQQYVLSSIPPKTVAASNNSV